MKVGVEVIDRSRPCYADNDAEEMTAEEFLAAFQSIRDPEVRASLIALITRLAEASSIEPPHH